MRALISVPKSPADLDGSRAAAPRHFARAVLVKALVYATNRSVDEFTKDDPVSPLIIQRAMAAPGTTTATGWAAELARDAFRSFLLDLAPYGGAARLIAQSVKASRPSSSEYATNYPVRASGAAKPAWVAECDPIPARGSDFVNIEVGPVRKQAHILAWSHELSKRTDADTVMELMLREDVSAGLDAAFFSTDAGSIAVHAGLLNGVTAGVGYSGGDASAAKADFMSLSTAVSVGGSGDVTFVMNPVRVARLRILDPVLFEALDIAPSTAVPDGRIIAADGAALIVSIDDNPDIEVTNNALLHMSDTPLPIVTGGVAAAPIRSLWQTASLAIRVIHELAFAKRRSSAVAYLDGATW